LDKHQYLEAGRVKVVCDNTYNMFTLSLWGTLTLTMGFLMDVELAFHLMQLLVLPMERRVASKVDVVSGLTREGTKNQEMKRMV